MMNPSSARLRALCTGVRAMVALASVLIIVLPLSVWWWPDLTQLWSSAYRDAPGVTINLTPRAHAICVALTLVPVGLGLAALWQLWQLFGHYAAGRALTLPAARHLRRFAWALLVAVLVQPLYRAAISVALTFENPPGHRHLFLRLSSDDYLLALLALVLLAIGAVMSDAVRAAEENRQFV